MSKVWTIGRVRNCLDAHLPQIACDKNGVVDWCTAPVEMPQTWFEDYWPLPLESLSWTPLKPQHSNPNPNPLANQLWCIDFLTPPTPLIIPHRVPIFLESLMPLENWCSIHAPKAFWSIPYGFRGIFSKFQTEFYCISSF